MASLERCRQGFLGQEDERSKKPRIASEPLYKYRTLEPGEIRVLRLFPGEAGDPLRGQIFTRPRKVHGGGDESDDDSDWFWNYEAISYVWGTSLMVHPLYVQDEGMILINDSLDSALRRLRYTDRCRNLWADAVCINQGDLEEKAIQVRNMSTVYRTSKHTLVHLGTVWEDENEAKKAVKLIKTCGQLDLRILRLNYRPPNISEIHDALVKAGLCSADESDATRDSCFSLMTRLFEHDWFHRLWVVQESHLKVIGNGARRVEYYERSGSWSGLELHSILLMFKSLRLDSLEYTVEERQHIDTIGELNASHWGSWVGRINDFLRYSGKLCVDPRDRIYALLGVLRLEHIDALLPDYNIEPAELFRSFTLLCLSNAENLEYCSQTPLPMLAWVGTEHEDPLFRREVSWVANLNRLSPASRARADMYYSGIMDSQTRGQDPFQYGLYWGSFTSLDRTKMDSRSLTLRGRCFATVTTRSTSTPVATRSDGTALVVRNHTDFGLYWKWYTSCRDFFVAHVITGSEHLDKELINFFRYPTYWSSYERRRNKRTGVVTADWVESSQQPGEHSFSKKLRAEMHWLILNMQACPVAKRRRMFSIISDTGRSDVAWLNEHAQEGDRICIIAGSWWPFIVREARDGKFRLIGDCHVYGTPFVEALGGLYGPDGEHENVTFKRGQPLGWNMPGLKVEKYMEGMGYITLC